MYSKIQYFCKVVYMWKEEGWFFQTELCIKQARTSGAWLALSVEHLTLDLRAVGSSPTFDVVPI